MPKKRVPGGTGISNPKQHTHRDKVRARLGRALQVGGGRSGLLLRGARVDGWPRR